MLDGLGARRIIIQAIEESATAAKKEAELKAANKEMHAAAVRLQNDAARIEKQRKEIEQLKDVIAKQKKPVQIVCPISHDVMLDPVVAADGHTYERAQIEKWLIITPPRR